MFLPSFFPLRFVPLHLYFSFHCGVQIRAGQWMFEGEDLLRLERTHRGSHWHHGIEADVFLLQLCTVFHPAMPRCLLRAIADHFTVRSSTPVTPFQ